MPVRMKPTSMIKANLGIDTNGRVQRFFTNECAKAMDKYVPMDEGNLRLYKIQDNNIIYDQLYARYQYYGVREDGTHKVEHYTTPGTGPYWDRRMWSAEGQDIVNRVQDYIGR